MNERDNLVFVLDFRILGRAVELRGGAWHTERLVNALMLNILECRDGIAPDVVRELCFKFLEKRNHPRHQWDGVLHDVVEMETCAGVH